MANSLQLPSDQLLEHFFGADSSAYFRETLIEPKDIDRLVQDIKPVAGRRNLVIIDGHSRVGKTWAVLAAICRIIDDDRSVHCWTAGEDCRDFFQGSEAATNVLEAIRSFLNVLKSESAQIFFLDDLLGTVMLGSLYDGESQRQELRNYLDYDRESSLWHRLPEGSTLVMTNRSALFTAAEVRLGCRIRPLDRPSELRRGLFRTTDGGIDGAFTTDELVEILKRNREVGKAAPAITVFAAPPDGTSRADSRTDVSSLLFKPDFSALREEVESLRGRSDIAKREGIVDSETFRATAQMCQAYMAQIAPALVFLGRPGYRVLGLKQNHESLIRDLFLRLPRLGQWARVPNEQYVAALKEHFENPFVLDTTVFALSQVSVPGSYELKVATRGLLEQALQRLPRQGKSSPALRPSLDSLVRDNNDPLFSWESQTDYSGKDSASLIVKPGFCAALGWALCRLTHLKGSNDKASQHGSRIIQWIKSELLTRFKNWKAHNSSEHDSLLASYSTFLHWAVDAKVSRQGSLFLNALAEVIDPLQGDAATQARMVFDDELLWACTALKPDERKIMYACPLVQSFRKTIRAEATGRTPPNHQTIANRRFTFAWHNEWRQQDSDLSADLKIWHDRWGEEPIQWHEHPVDSNLTYHWTHFLTQHGAWMRDWCFDGDPIKFETQRPAAGSSDAAHNLQLHQLFASLLSDGRHDEGFPNRLRNCVMLLGSRTARLPSNCDFRRILDAAVCSDDVGEQAALEAIFELARENYFSRSDDLSPEFTNWCRTIIEASSQVDDAWQKYLEELTSVTHLDLLPASPEEILPEEWLRKG